MGQAKKRGTREERIRQAQARAQLRKDLAILTAADRDGTAALLTTLMATPTKP